MEQVEPHILILRKEVKVVDDKTRELVAVGASITAGCQFCLKYHADKARKNGATEDEVMEAIAVAKTVIGGGATEMDRFLDEFADMGTKSRGTATVSQSGGCDCGGACC